MFNWLIKQIELLNQLPEDWCYSMIAGGELEEWMDDEQWRERNGYR